jgi:hypothetical protein
MSNLRDNTTGFAMKSLSMAAEVNGRATSVVDSSLLRKHCENIGAWRMGEKDGDCHHDRDPVITWTLL